MTSPQVICITGASSGLGAALALHYAQAGRILLLTARNSTRLAEVAQRCTAKGAHVVSASVDVCNREALNHWLLAMDAQHPIDLLIANAGVSGGSGGQTEPEAQLRQIFAVNVDGVLNSLCPLIPRMIARQKGQIAIISSLASMRALPSTPAYSASKAAVRYYGEAMRGLLQRYGVAVNVVCPGYIRTPMTDVNTFPMPFLMDADKAAAKIARGLARNRARIAFPFPLFALVWFLSILPPAWTDPLFSRLPAKPVTF